MVGVWAATADALDSTLQIQTTVSQLAGFKVTQAAKTSNSYADFVSMPTADLLTVDRAGSFGMNGESAITAYITAANNKNNNYTIGVLATAMAGETSGNTSKINYEVLINNVSKWNTTSTSTTPATALIVTGSATTGMVVQSTPITINVNTVDYDNAAPDTYVGLITFSVTSNS
jgi:hypothetical protein